MSKLIMVAGLPGSGKTSLSRRLQAEIRWSVRVSSDDIRHMLFAKPKYLQEEHSLIFGIIEPMVTQLLLDNDRFDRTVILDATLLTRRNRDRYVAIAEGQGATTIMVWVRADRDVIHQRLVHRKLDPTDNSGSDAGWDIYERMEPTAEVPGIGQALFFDSDSSDADGAFVALVDLIQGTRRSVV